jgi:predicted aldo/keto reductase-like oxidoreductase
MQRREFLASSAGVPGGAAVSHSSNAQGSSYGYPACAAASHEAAVRIPRVTDAGILRGEMLYRKLGQTGVEVSAIGLGRWHLGASSLSDQEATRLIHEAIDRGVNFLDNSWDYYGGVSEERVGNALAQGGYRQKAFVMTKLDGRTRQIAAQQIDTSLKRLKVDHVDLLQHHEVIRYEDPNRIFGGDGAMEAVLAAKQAGKVRFIGFTGHKDPHIHLYMLDVAERHGFHFDTVQMPVNIMDAHFRSFSQLVVPEALKRGVAMLAMKSFGNGIILESGTVQPMDCLHYALNVPVSVVITGINTQQLLDQAFAAVKNFKPMDEAALAALIAKTEAKAEDGKYELFKTSSVFDSTAHNPAWLGPDNPEVEELSKNTPK